MALTRFGGLVLIGGWTLLAAGILLTWVTAPGVGGAVVDASLGIAGAGFLVLAMTEAPPLRGRVLRAGVGILGVGLVCLAGSFIAAARLAYDPLEDAPTVVLLFAGGLATMIGAPLSLLSLLLTPGRPRVVGAAFVAGVALLALASAAHPSLGAVLAAVPAIAGGLLLFAGGVGLGLPAVTGGRATPAASA